MRLNSRQWFLVSVLLLGAAAWFWHLDEVRWQRLQGEKSGLARQQTAPGQPVRPAFALQSKPYPALAKVTNNPAAKTTVMAKADTNRFPFRLRNTPRSVDELSHSDTAILLQNAFLDTANGTALQVPPHLRAGNAAGSYVVQSRGVIDDRFRAALRDAGATTISYIPNNAYLVRADEGAIQSLSASPSVQAVMPFDPYFKLDEQLLPLAVKQEPLPPESMLRVTLFPDERDATLAKFQALGVETIGEDRSPFGPVLMVRPPAESLVALANIPSVQGLEVYNHRVLHNDLARVRMSVATDTVTTTNYNGLTGKGIMVSLNDTGVDVSNPDLAGRVFSNDTNTFTLQDLDGHGTHTAGTIASSGASSASVKYASGSVSNANFRGQAPQAKIFILPVFLTTGPLISDAFVQETAARTNAFVSNNSWGYPGVNNYGSVSASYDAAVRDALPTVTGSQPLLYVFSAGNSGEGDNGGQGGIPGSVTQPGTGKNVITVGATENLRQLTNTVIFTNMVDGTNVLTTNQFYFGWTDSDDEVAFFSSRGNVSAGTEGSAGRFKPDVVAPGTFIVSTRSRYWNVDPRSPLYTIDKELNDPLAPVYRYESGTSMAAPAVSGMLVLMQEFFEQRMRQTNSPAAMKALLINGARPVARQYDYNTRASINYQGWGMVNLTNSVPLFYNAYAGKSINDVNPATAPVPHFFFDQSSAPLPAPGTAAPARPQNHALATGQTDAWQLNVTDDGSLQNLRFTLVWTDPPGNPAAAVKLVNDLDLVVSNTVTHEVFYGNNIPDGADFTQPQDPGATAEQVIDSINNVENVFLRAPLDSSYVVSVFARKVNVNAVVGNTNDIVQDYALVISSGQGDITNAFTLASLPTTPRQSQAVSVVTNGVALLNQHVGANFPLTNSTAGQTNQWNFYIFTNLYQQSLFGTLTNGSNVAFVTFLPPNLGTPRNEEADIDLYVSTNPAITNLDPAAISSSFKSNGRGGSQVVFFTNATPDTVYYVGVKSEDQQSAEYALYGISSDLPFADIDSNGTMHLRGFPVSAVIPDGSPEKPGVVNMVAIGISPLVAGLVTVDNEVIHESFGDLVGTLSHNGQYVVLNNHFADIGVIDHIFHYDDSQSGRSPITRPTDGPGRLTDYVGASASGLWLLTMSDNAPAHIGTNLQFRVNITPAGAVAGGLDGTVFANAWNYYFIDVPADATSLTINLTRMSGPLDVFARLNDIPDTANYDKSASLTPPGGSLTITVNDVPPLNAGRYYIGVFNPNAVPVTYHIDATIERNPKAEIAQLFTSTNTPVAVLDQALTQSGIDVKDPRSVVEARVGVRIDHPRIADLVLHLVSPEGTRVLLAENRGGATTNGYGAGKAYAGFTDNTNLTDQLIKFAKPPFATNTSLTTNLVSGFEGVSARGYNTGEVFDGWTVENVFVTTNATGSGFTRSLPTVINDPGIAQSGNSYLNLGRGDISREIPTQPGVNYTLTFAYRSAGTGPINAQILLDGSLNSFISAAGTNWQSKTIQFVASSSSTTLEILPGLNNPGLLLDTFELAGVAGIIYYFPEEPLEILKGQGALGRWNLEVLDNRAGPSTNGVLLSWQLQLVLSRTNAFVTKVTNGIPVNGTVQGAGITYFSVDVPREATFATNVVISGGDMVLLYSGSGLPTGSLPNDVVVDRFGPGGEILVLDTNTPPVLRPGQRYYLGVANFNPFETNDFTLFVDFDLGDSGLIGPTVLTNGVGFTHTIAVTNAIDYYQFTVSSNAYSATFELFPQNGNVDMIIRRGLPVRDPLPTYNVYDYGSFQSDTNVEQVIVTTNSAPVALGPGVWYIGVFNSDTNAVKYTVRATEALNPYLIIPLKSGVPVNVTQNVTNVVTNFFVFSIPASNADNTVYARFDLFNASAPATLYVNPDNLFDPSEALYRTNTGPAGGARLFVTPSGTNTIAGDWYLNVGGYAVTNIDFTVMATLLTNGFPPITTLSNAVTVTNYALGSLDAPRLDYYRFTVTTNAKYADFELFPISGNVDLLLIKGPGLPDTNRFDYASQNTALTNEFIRVGRGSSPVSLTPGDWFLAVYNREDYAARYAIRVTQALDGAVRSIGPDITYPGFAATRSLDYYQITVPSGATALNIQLSFTNATARQLRMFLRKGKPLPDAANFDYQSGSASAPGDFVGVEAVSVSPSSLPVALTPGDWFLSVTNTGSLALNYDLSYHLTGDIAQPTNNVEVPSQLVISNNQVCVLWKAQIGSSYKVEGKASLTQTNWVADSGVIVANVTNEQYCVSFSDTNRFFRVMLQGGGGSGGSTNATEITVGQQPTITSTSFCLSWSSVVNTVYHVEGKVSLNQANWVTVSPAITATSTTSSYCVPLTDTNRFFRVVK